MADEPDDTKASYKLVVNPNPDKDELSLYVHYRNVWVRLQWKDSEQQDVRDLLSQEDRFWFLDRGHLEYEVHRQSFQIDGDIDSLLSETDEGESE